MESAATHPITTLDLVSKLFGFFGLGAAAYSHLPQVLENFALQTGRGLTWTLLIVWVLADAMVLAGQIIMGALQTQIVQTSWYLVGDSFLCFQKAFYEGRIPLTNRRRERKLQDHHSNRARLRDAIPRNSRHVKAFHDALHGQTSAPVSRSHASTSHSLGKSASSREKPHERYDSEDESEVESGHVLLHHQEYALAKSAHRSATSNAEDTGSPSPRKDAIRAWIVKSFGSQEGSRQHIWQPLCIGMMFVLMVIVWIATSLVPRDSLSHIEHPASPFSPVADEWAAPGFALGIIGIFLYNAPRIVQLHKIIAEHSAEAINRWMFITLILENLAMLTSILLVSRESDYLISESPFIAGAILAITFDLIFYFLWVRYRGRAPPSASDDELNCRPWFAGIAAIADYPLSQYHRKHDEALRQKLAQETRRHLLDSEIYNTPPPRVQSDERRARRAALDKRADELRAAGDALQRHVDLAGHKGRRAAAHSGYYESQRRKIDAHAKTRAESDDEIDEREKKESQGHAAAEEGRIRPTSSMRSSHRGSV